jgi:hypothetical protein
MSIGLTHESNSIRCSLSHTLFSLYINELSTLFHATCDPVNLNDTQLSCLLYADDLVLISQSGVGLQSCLDKLSDYCDQWNLRVNINKTKVMIFTPILELKKSVTPS